MQTGVTIRTSRYFILRASTDRARSDPERAGGHSYLFAPGTAASGANKKPGQLPE